MSEKMITIKQLKATLIQIKSLITQITQTIRQDIAALTAVDVGAVPIMRKVNGKTLNTDITLSATDIGAAASSHTHTAQTSVSGNAGTATKLQTARKIGNASFDGSADITLADIGAAASSHTHTAANVGAVPLAGGTMTGALTAKDDTAYTTSKVRNVKFGTSDLTANSTSLSSGSVALIYE